MILDKIVSDNLPGLAERQRRVPLAEMRRLAASQPSALDFAAALQGNGIRIIAEVKKASPSRGLLCPDFDPVKLAGIFAANGAAAISVLTEERHFQGSLEYLKTIRQTVKLPLLRKDFIHDPYQVYEARVYGADAFLLIAAILAPSQLQELLDLGKQLGMQALVEVHDEAEVEMVLKSSARIIGINNRDLHTFNVDIATTGRLRRLILSDRLVVSESGIHTRADIEKMACMNVNAILVGEALVTAKDIPAKIKELL